MDLDRPLALVSVGGVAVISVGAVAAGLLGWPATTGLPEATGDTVATAISPVAVSLVAALLGCSLVAAVWWGRTDSSHTPYWGS